jgi:hypothetical protein
MNPPVAKSLHIYAQSVSPYENKFQRHTSYGIGFYDGNSERSDEVWFFDRRSDAKGHVCTVREAAEVMVRDGIASFEMSRTGIICEFDPEAAERLRNVSIKLKHLG